MNSNNPEDDNGTPPSVEVPLKEQIAVIRKDESYNQLFRELSKPKSPLSRYLLRHAEDLFPKLDPDDAVIPADYSILFPLLLRENFEEISREEFKRPSITDHMKNNSLFEESESIVEYEEPSKEITVSEDREFEELIILNGLRLLQHNPHLLELAQQKEDITLPDVKRVIGQKDVDYQPIKDEALHMMERFAEEQGLGDIFKILLRRSDSDTETAYELKKMGKEIYIYLRDILIDAPTFMGEIHRLFPNVINEHGVPFFRKHNNYVNWSYEYTNRDYNKALNFLWELDLLNPVVVSLICLNCHDAEDKPIHQVLNSDIAPKDLDKKVYCSWCKKPMIVQAFYTLDSILNRIILAEDKLLSYLVAYLLDEFGLEWEHRVYTDKSEHDFHVKTSRGLHIIECKVFRVSGPVKDDIRLQQKIRDGINQVVQHIIEIKAESAFLVCYPCPVNRKDLDKLISNIIKQKNLIIDKNRINVVGPDGLNKALERLQ